MKTKQPNESTGAKAAKIAGRILTEPMAEDANICIVTRTSGKRGGSYVEVMAPLCTGAELKTVAASALTQAEKDKAAKQLPVKVFKKAKR